MRKGRAHLLGNTVIVCGRRAERLAELGERSPGIVGLPCDITDADQRRELAERVVAEYPSLDVLVNNAAVQLRFDVTEPVDLDRVLVGGAARMRAAPEQMFAAMNR